MTVKEGDKAPDFSLVSNTGATVALRDLAGKKVVLYFYPKDNTPGCTKEACNLRDNHAALEQAGAVVLGVSTDSLKSHQNFAGKYSLPFQLLSDEGAKVADSYGVWGERVNYGKKYMGMFRTTFLVDEKGTISKIWPKVKVDTHGTDVLKAITG